MFVRLQEGEKCCVLGTTFDCLLLVHQFILRPGAMCADHGYGTWGSFAGGGCIGWACWGCSKCAGVSIFSTAAAHGLRACFVLPSSCQDAALTYHMLRSGCMR